MSEIDKLIERCRSSEGDDMVLSNDIWRVVRGQTTGAVLYDETPDLTSSIDAAIALIEKELPGWNWNIGHDANNELHATIWSGGTEYDEYAATAPLALCLTFLSKAKPSQGDEK